MNDGVKVISANKGIQKQNTIGTQESRIHSTIPNHYKITQNKYSELFQIDILC